MPIRINLLAEARELEELRRRDPVKRAILLGVLVILAVGAFSVWMQLQVMIVKKELNKIDGQVSSRSSEYQQVLDNQKRLGDMTHKLSSLQQMATNRLLYGSLLNAFQQATIDDVQLTRLRADQSYFFTEGTKAKTNAEERVIPGRPASVTEKILLTIEARDSGANPGDQVNKFKQVIADAPYFRANLGKTNEVRLTNLSPPMAVDGKPFVQFTLEIRYPERIR